MAGDVRVLDLFAGTGVGVACRNLGIVEYGVEIMPEAVATRDAVGFNTPYRDVWDIDQAGKLDFNTIWASPPCQSFSAAGKGEGRRVLGDVLNAITSGAWQSMASLRELGATVGDERTALVLTPLTYIDRFRPLYVALEQVPPVLPVWEAYAGVLGGLGYSVWTGYLHSEQYGVPQTRKRAYLIARRDGAPAAPPPPTHSRYYPRSPERLDPGVEKWVSLDEALGWNQSDALISNYSTTKGGLSVIGSKRNRSFRLATQPGLGVTSKMPSRSDSSFQPPSMPTRVTPDGAAILQGYPSGFPFQGAKGKVHLQIGNAVPPPVAEAVLQGFM